MTNPKAGHTSATGMSTNAQGLRDGDGLTSPSLTNLYEGLHGNGILRLADGAKGDSLRNSIVSGTPGYIEEGSGAAELTVYGGYCVLDGVLYKFAGGPGSSETFAVGTTANYSGYLHSVPTSNSEVFVVVYLVGRNTPEAHLKYEIGTPTAPSVGTPLVPSRFLSSPSTTGDTDTNHQSTVIAVVRWGMTGGAGNVNASLASNTPTIHDRRTFLRPTPVYFTRMTEGAIGNVDTANAINSVATLDGFFPSPETGNLSASVYGAMWQCHREDVAGNKHALLYAALPRSLNTTPVTNTHVLGPDRVEVVTASSDITFTFDQANIWIVTTATTNRSMTPTGGAGSFPVGHTVEVYHTAGAHQLNFINAPAGSSTLLNVAVDQYAKFVFDGTNWHVLDHHAVI